MERFLKLLVLLWFLALTVSAWADTFPGGFLESQGATATRARYSTATLNGFIPSTRSCFTFPAPYNTRGCRLTIPADCPTNQDCVWYVGYSYWKNINNHVNDPQLLFFLNLATQRGGT